MKLHAPTELPARATPGPLLFARYAYPPNALGYCGSDPASTLLEYGAANASDGGLVELARSFDGAWPYLELIAGAAGTADPLAPAVAEAYWLGNQLLERVDMRGFAEHLDDRFRHKAGRTWEELRDTIPAGALPHHNFHVFCVYPWVGLMRGGHIDQPLETIERCRIRSGTVESVAGDTAIVQVKRLRWDGHALHVGPATAERLTWRLDNRAFVGELKAGDRVSIHWNWICDRITRRQAAQLSYYTNRILAIVNSTSIPAAVA